jgi:hypothetical protein
LPDELIRIFEHLRLAWLADMVGELLGAGPTFYWAAPMVSNITYHSLKEAN